MSKRSKLFEFAAILHPAEGDEGKGQKSELIVPPTTVLAVDDKSAFMQAARSIPSKYVDMLERIEIAVKPF